MDPQITSDLARFGEIDMNQMLREALRRYDRPGSVSFCHYVVIKNKVGVSSFVHAFMYYNVVC